MKKVTILKSLLNEHIIDHFESEGKYDYEESNKTVFEHTFRVRIEGKQYIAVVEYDVDYIGVYKPENVTLMDLDKWYSLENENLIISNKDYNPNKKTIREVFDSILEHMARIKRERKEFDYNKGTQIS
jgi:hypothetical protein